MNAGRGDEQMSMVKDAGKAMLQGQEMPWSLYMLEARCVMGGSPPGH